jgi:hypothetical protein
MRASNRRGYARNWQIFRRALVSRISYCVHDLAQLTDADDGSDYLKVEQGGIARLCALASLFEDGPLRLNSWRRLPAGAIDARDGVGEGMTLVLR